MKDNIKQFFYLLDKKAKFSIPFLILAFLFLSLLDVIGIGLVGGFLALLANPTAVVGKFPQLHFIVDNFSGTKLIYGCGIIIVVAFLLKGTFTLFIQAKVMFFCKFFAVRLKTRLMRAYQYAPYTYHLKVNSAHLLSRIQGNADTHVTMMLSVLNFISNALIALSILFFLAILHPFITAFLGFMFFLLGFSFDFFAKKKLSYYGKIAAQSVGELTKVIHHGLYGLVEIRVLNKEKYFLHSLTSVSEQFAKSTSVLSILQQAPRYLLENTIAMFMVGVCLIGIMAGYDTGSLIAMIGVFGAAGARLLPTFNQIMSTGNDLRAYSPHMHLIYNDLKKLEDLSEETVNSRQSMSCQEPYQFNTIDLVNISYQYPDTQCFALSNINLKIKRGQSIGLVGPSGAGKSTLVNLILGFLQPSQGYLMTDMKVIPNLRAWLNNIAYIPQTIFLLDDSLKRNIALGVEDEKIDKTKLFNAVKMAQLGEVIEALPEGVDTVIGEKGVRLSGGQRQRVALARAFYHERDIIVLDEATSSLDNDTEKEVINTIRRLKGHKTLIVIAHRLSTVEHCDILYKLERGCITSMGSFEEVIGSSFS